MSWVAHTHQVRTELADLLSELKDAETGQRGYLITGDDSYLAPYQSALGAIKATLDDVRKLTSDNPDQQRRLAAISPVIDAKLAELKQTIDLRRTEGLDAAAKVVVTNAGKTDMDQIRALVAEADQEEKDLLKRRSEEARASADTTMLIILWGGLFGTLAVAAIGWFIIKLAVAADRLPRSAGSKLIDRAAGRGQSAGDRRQGAGGGHDRDQHHDQRASGDVAPDRRKRPARGPERRADRERGALGSRHGRHDPRVRSPASAARSIRSSPICSSSARNRRRSAPSSTSSPNWPSRPTFSPSTRPSRRPAPARRASALRWSPTRSASWPIASAARPRRCEP